MYPGDIPQPGAFALQRFPGVRTIRAARPAADRFGYHDNRHGHEDNAARCPFTRAPSRRKTGRFPPKPASFPPAEALHAQSNPPADREPRGGFVYYRIPHRGWTQEDLAEKVGVHVRTIQRAEKGEGVRGWVLCAVAKALDMPLEKLLPNEAPQLEPTEAFKKSAHALLKLLFDLPKPESVEMAAQEQYGEKVLGALSLVGLLRDSRDEPSTSAPATASSLNALP